MAKQRHHSIRENPHQQDVYATGLLFKETHHYLENHFHMGNSLLYVMIVYCEKAGTLSDFCPLSSNLESVRFHQILMFDFDKTFITKVA